jgi:hypothetical protein
VTGSVTTPAKSSTTRQTPLTLSKPQPHTPKTFSPLRTCLLAPKSRPSPFFSASQTPVKKRKTTSGPVPDTSSMSLPSLSPFPYVQAILSPPPTGSLLSNPICGPIYTSTSPFPARRRVPVRERFRRCVSASTALPTVSSSSSGPPPKKLKATNELRPDAHLSTPPLTPTSTSPPLSIPFLSLPDILSQPPTGPVVSSPTRGPIYTFTGPLNVLPRGRLKSLPISSTWKQSARISKEAEVKKATTTEPTPYQGLAKRPAAPLGDGP